MNQLTQKTKTLLCTSAKNCMSGSRVMREIDNSNDLEWKEIFCPSVISQGKEIPRLILVGPKKYHCWFPR